MARALHESCASFKASVIIHVNTAVILFFKNFFGGGGEEETSW